jgi:hypothetical protein
LTTYEHELLMVEPLTMMRFEDDEEEGEGEEGEREGEDKEEDRDDSDSPPSPNNIGLRSDESHPPRSAHTSVSSCCTSA